MTTDDMDLVREYAASQSESAFEAILTRHVNLVYSAAFRQTRDHHIAEEVTQTVFLILAHKAASLSPATILPGWLYRTARFVSAAALKQETRRHRREEEAQTESTLHESAAGSAWEQLAPVLDEAMTHLREKDRDAVVLRYFENKSLRAVGVALGVDERAAQKRVSRGLAKLRSWFARRGFVLTPSAIAGAVSANSVQASPVGLTASAFAAVTASTTTTATLTLLKATMKAMFYAKVKTIGTAAAIVVVALGAGTLFAQKDARRGAGQAPLPPADSFRLTVEEVVRSSACNVLALKVDVRSAEMLVLSWGNGGGGSTILNQGREGSIVFASMLGEGDSLCHTVTVIQSSVNGSHTTARMSYTLAPDEKLESVFSLTVTNGVYKLDRPLMLGSRKGESMQLVVGRWSSAK